ncbi:MAG: polymer-forming cytoskeletal protein [Venatoribacter sp.]
MFGNKNKSDTHYDTLISSKTEIIGDIKFSGGLHIDGLVKGNIMADAGTGAVIRVSDKGCIEGRITAPNIIINGRVRGDVHALEYIELAKKAQVQGDVYYQMMEMVLGAEVNGKLNHQNKGKKVEPLQTAAAIVEAAKVKTPITAPAGVNAKVD